ncbi:MAG: MOSC domain-containing protein [Actinomycetota bacterium]
MITVGPYSFSDTDAQRTVQHADDVLDLYASGRDASIVDALRPSLSGDLATDLERVWSAWNAAGPALRAAGELPARQEGSVVQLNLSNGGLPKLPVESVMVGWDGVKGDRQATRQHHGRPWQALCLWSLEVIETFRADGHPLGAGLAGENITVSGLHWPDVRPGVRLQVGDVVCDVSSFAVPCSQNTEWFIGGDFRLMHHDRGPVSRVYATVLQPGRISKGDAVVLEP